MNGSSRKITPFCSLSSFSFRAGGAPALEFYGTVEGRQEEAKFHGSFNSAALIRPHERRRNQRLEARRSALNVERLKSLSAIFIYIVAGFPA